VEVVEWLNSTKPDIKLRRGHGQPALLASLNSLRDMVLPTVSSELALALCCARKLSLDTGSLIWGEVLREPLPSIDALRREAEAAGADDPCWADVVSVLDDFVHHAGARLEPAAFSAIVAAVDNIHPDHLAQAADETLQHGATGRGRAGGYAAGEQGFVGSRVSELLANLAATTSGVVYDPACGVGEALVRTWSKTKGQAQVVGHEINLKALRTARMRCVLHGIPAALHLADVLHDSPDPSLRADIVIAEPPFGMAWRRSQNIADPRWAFGLAPANNSDLAWIQHAIAHTKREGTAFVITTLGSLSQGGASSAIRTELLRGGCIDAIVALPAKMLPHTGIGLALWVLRSPERPLDGDPVLLIDASESSDPELWIDSWLDLGTGPDVPDDAPPHSFVDTVDLLAANAQLDPRRWIHTPESDPDVAAARYRGAQNAIGASLASLSDSALIPHLGGPLPKARVLTVKELCQLDAATIQSGRARIEEFGDDEAVWLVTPRVLRNGLPTLEGSGHPVSISRVSGWVLTRPGDILVSTMNNVRAVVDEYGGRVVGSGVYRLQIDDSLCDPHYVARCLSGTWNERFRQGTSIQRVDLKELEIPILPLADQKRVVAALQSAELLARAAELVVEAASATCAAILDVVRYAAPLPEGADE
jgi:hypothetical protein